MLTFLFWNSKAASAQLVAELVHEHEVDVLMLVETKLDDASVVGAISSLDGAAFSADALPTGFKLYTRFEAKGVVTPEADSNSMAMRRIRTQQGDVLLVIAHLRSKFSTSDAGQAALVPTYAHEIGRIEDKIGDKKTILVGDLNMDPFEPGVVGMTGFHAIPNHRIATERGRPGHKGEREVEGRYFPFFYNPMWNFFGDERNGPGGTLFRDKSDPISYFWHIYSTKY